MRRFRVAVVHGVNLDQLGRRDPHHYGTLTFRELERQIEVWSAELDMTPRFFQTNHEGSLVEHLHRLEGLVDGLLLNAGAWTHYSWALRDALDLANVPAIEVHLSDVAQREEFRRQSVFAGLTLATVQGKGPEGYREALATLHAHLLEVTPPRTPATGTPTEEHLATPETPQITDPDSTEHPLHDENAADPAAAPPMPAQDPTPPSTTSTEGAGA
ncbi:type II 3-dehydroquinate dehydratase [Patulibacter sp. SYSU D01012]|uniref:type II 3-dehydroquinate dehydratase n=1 Tax=Patulibacter sp. SYSU D01012 TaxID=2817381 RepID=UPI001B307E39|nr:type II 3-dehydroquinate dehydratase [Patulibacter sp. SYSU D01012]